MMTRRWLWRLSVPIGLAISVLPLPQGLAAQAQPVALSPETTGQPAMMLGTLVGMYFWARCYQRYPNIYALALSHAFLSAVLMQAMPKWLLPSVSVGHRFVEKGIAQHWWGWL